MIAMLAIVAIIVHLALRLAGAESANIPLYIALVLGGVPLVWELASHVVRLEFGADLLAGISIVTAAILGEYLAGTLVVLMLSGGGALEHFAVRSASSVLEALARRMPTTAHRKNKAALEDIELDSVQIGDILVILPHEVCPADGTVIEGHGSMDESYLTGEPYIMSKTPGAAVLSGAINGESALTIRATKRPVDSRYAKIMEVMEQSQQQRPQMRRLADRLGAFYTPIALVLAGAAWAISGDPVRFLAVLVVATPCPLLIAIPVAIIGSISLAAKRSIIIRDPIVLERIGSCRTMILDKTGTLTYGKPKLIEEACAAGVDADEALSLAASLEQYSKHPLAGAVLEAARQRGLALREAANISEPPGEGLRGHIADRAVRITSRSRLLAEQPQAADIVPARKGGLECILMIDGAFAAWYQFRDAPRTESRSFIEHLDGRHGIRNVLLVSGDRESEVSYLAGQVGIDRIYAGQSPEQKVEIVRRQNAEGPTIFVGDGINDAPALMTATVGVAMGTESDITVEAAGAVILDSSLGRVDELLHISARMRRIALQSAVGGMALSVGGMLVAGAGYLPPVAGAVTQELIDVLVIVNALRIAMRPRTLTDF
ncbi:MAG: heavy metal translocating P-type ATPase [Phycisphaerales bacterium JB039]